MAASTSGVPAQGEVRAEVLRLSAQQAERFAVDGSPVLFERPAFYPMLRMGVRPRGRNPEVTCVLRVTQDGMVTCTVQGTGELVWSAHLDPPNEWRFSGVTFAFVRVGDGSFTVRKGPFVANLSRNIAVPFVGFVKMFGGFRRRRELGRVLSERQTGGPSQPAS